MVVLAIVTSLFIAIQDPIIQKFAVRFAGGFLSEKTGADIKVGRLVVTPSFRVFVDEVSVKDLKKNDLAKIGALRTKISIGDLLEGIIHLDNVELRDTEANLITYQGEDQMNFAFLLDAFASADTTRKKESKPMPIIVDRISLKNIDFMLWNQNSSDSLKTANGVMDYAHLDLDDINLEASDFYMFGDSIHANIANLSAKEMSGIELKSFSTDAVVCSKGVFLKGLLMETNNSRFDMDLNMLYNDMTAFGSFVDSVVFDATIRPTEVMLSDIGVFSDIMYKMPDLVKFEGRFTGPIEHFRVDDIKVKFGNSTAFEGNISMHPLDFENGYHTLKIKNMSFTYDDLVNFYIPSSTKTIPLPESLRAMDRGRLNLDFNGSYNNFSSDISLVSGIGDIDASVARAKDAKGDNVFSGNVKADKVKAGAVANASKFVGDLDLDANFMAKFPQKGSPEFWLDGVATDAHLLGNHIDEVKMDGTLVGNRFKGKVNVDDDDLFLDFNGLIDFRDPKFPQSDFEAVIKNANLSALSLMKSDSISEISTRIVANMKGFDLDGLEGELSLDSTIYRDSRGTYTMKTFAASIHNDNLMQRRINIGCDFFNFEMAGQVNFASLMRVLNEYGDSFVHFPQWQTDREDFKKYARKHDVDQDFIVSLNLKDTRTLSRLFMPSLKIAKNTSVNGTFTSRSRQLNLTARSKSIEIGKVAINDFELRNFNTRSHSYGRIAVGRVEWTNITATDTMNFGLDNLSLFAKMGNDTIATQIRWDDADTCDHNKSAIDLAFHPHETGGIVNISKVDLVINDSLWNIAPSNFIDMNDGRVNISNLMFSHNRQSLRVDGYVPMNEGDTISLQLRSFDISNFDIFTESMGFDIDGFISGDAMLSSLKANPMLLADLNIKRLGVNGDLVGDAEIVSSWDNEEKSVDVEAEILNDAKRMLNAYGSYYTARDGDNLDFTIALDSLRLAVASPFLTGIVTRMQGYANGLVDIKGTLNQPEINGKVSIVDGGCKVGYLNTFYTFSPTILIDNKSISFENMVMTDTTGNTALVEGEIRHNRMKDFYLDLRLHPRNFLAMATTSKDNDSFYGSAIANGLVYVKGPVNDIFLGIKARTQAGTALTIPLNKASTVKDNDFIVFVAPPVETEEEEEGIHEEKEMKKRSNFAISLDVDATDDATMKIMLPSDIGTIEASGNGNVKLNTSTTEPLTMYGNYTISSGRFQLTLMNLVTRNFSLKKGGTISWSGSPTDGRINATGVYSLKASLADLGLQVDSTANNNVNVECLIHLKDALLNPTISFGMNLPNANEDIIQTVYSLVDTTNQTVMAQQALTLLVLGKFAYAGGSSGVAQTLNLSHMFSANLNVDITKNLNLGVSYHSGDVDTYDEYQFALRTELFENRLTIETNLGVIASNSVSGGNASNIVGEFDLYYKLSKDGRLQAHFYNHSNYNSNFNSFAIDKRAPYTQGLGLSYSRSFTTFRDLFRKKTVPSNQPFIPRSRKPENN